MGLKIQEYVSFFEHPAAKTEVHIRVLGADLIDGLITYRVKAGNVQSCNGISAGLLELEPA
jgi:hypothetical protein